ncbi:unnamed protein product [Diplocarpon coronariae]
MSVQSFGPPKQRNSIDSSAVESEKGNPQLLRM